VVRWVAAWIITLFVLIPAIFGSIAFVIFFYIRLIEFIGRVVA
jgi:hypothetical protein